MQKYLKKLSMRSQVIIIQSIIAILVLFILTITYLSLCLRIIYFMEESSSKALLRINNGQVNQVSVALKSMLDDQFEDIYRNLNKTQKLFLISEQLVSHDLTYCDVYSPTINLTINYSQLFHCVFLTKQYLLQSPDQYLNFQKFIYLYDSMILAMWKEEIQSSHIISGLQDPKLIASYPKSYFTDQFRIESRPYYIQHFNQKSDINIADPFYFYGSNKVVVFVTRVLKDEKQLNQMLVGFGISLDLLDNFIKLKNTKLLFCTLSGMILASNLLDTLTLSTLNKQTYIYNQTYFDFDINDWKEMKNYLDKKSFLSDCTNDYNYFCRKVNGSDVQIHVTVIQGKFLLIIFNDLSFVKSYQDNINNIIDELFFTIISQTLLFCCIGITIIFISFGLLTLILRPVAQIIKLIEQQIRTQIQEIDKVQQDQIIKKDLFDILKESYMSFLVSFRESRNIYGQQLNKFNYPKMPKLKTDFQDIQNIQNLQNQKDELSPQFRKRMNSRSFHTQGFEEFEQNSNLLNLIKTLTLN